MTTDDTTTALEKLAAAGLLIHDINPAELDAAGRVQLALVCSTSVLAQMLATNPLAEKLADFVTAANSLAAALDQSAAC